MDIIIWFIGIIIGYNILYTLTVTINKKKLEKITETGRAHFIIKRYQLNNKKINNQTFAIQLGFIDSTILALTFTIIFYIPNFVLQMLIGFIILVPLTLITYHILGTYYKKKEGKTCIITKK